MKMTLSPFENSALLALLVRPYGSSSLHDYLSAKHHISRAGFYKVLKGLKEKEIIVQDKKTLSVNKIWLSEIQDFFGTLKEQKTKPSYLAEHISKLQVDERLVYVFRSIKEIDIFILNLLLDVSLLQSEKKILIREPHEFFVLLNSERTLRLLKELERSGQSLALLVESIDSIDSEILKQYVRLPAEGYRLPMRLTGSDAQKIIHIIGDVVIELQLAKQFIAKLSTLFSENQEISETFIAGLKELTNKKDKHRIVIYRDAKKTQALQKRFKKYFP